MTKLTCYSLGPESCRLVVNIGLTELAFICIVFAVRIAGASPVPINRDERVAVKSIGLATYFTDYADF